MAFRTLFVILVCWSCNLVVCNQHYSVIQRAWPKNWASYVGKRLSDTIGSTTLLAFPETSCLRLCWFIGNCYAAQYNDSDTKCTLIKNSSQATVVSSNDMAIVTYLPMTSDQPAFMFPLIDRSISQFCPMTLADNYGSENLSGPVTISGSIAKLINNYFTTLGKTYWFPEATMSFPATPYIEFSDISVANKLNIFSGSFTVTFFLRFGTPVPGDMPILEFASTSTTQACASFRSGCHGECIHFLYSGSCTCATFQTASTPGSVAQGYWQHYAITYDRQSSSLKAYINAINKLDMQLALATSTVHPNKLLIGVTYCNQFGAWFNTFFGSVAQLRLYTSTLTASQIQQVYFVDKHDKFQED